MLRALKQLTSLLHRYTFGWFTRAMTRRVGPASPRAQAHHSKNKKRTRRNQRLHLESLEDRRVFAAGFAEFIDPNPAPGNQFGDSIVPLSTGNVVITSPFDDAGGPDAGAVYLFNGRTGKLISTLTGSHRAKIVPLASGHFVVQSSFGVTFGNGVAGVSGAVDSTNSLVGNGLGFVQPLPNGNYVVLSQSWDNGSIVDTGAATFGNGLTGVVGAIDASNSLIGTSKDDRVGALITVLKNGNYVIRSPLWTNGAAQRAGAATFGNGMTGVAGEVSADNSLVGTSSFDAIGNNAPGGYSGGVVPLANGNYVVVSPAWNNGEIDTVGAVTFGSGTVGVKGIVSEANSLIGASSGDKIGGTAVNNLDPGVVPLANGNYVVVSSDWGAYSSKGAVTFGNGLTGIVGKVSAANSLVGREGVDNVGIGGVTALTNGNYVVSSFLKGDDTYSYFGAVTFGNGNTGIVGEFTPANSLLTGYDLYGSLGATVTPLANGNYVVSSPKWDNGEIDSAGAVTFGNGMTGTVGVVSEANSLVGGTAGDRVGWGGYVVGGSGIEPLANGNYVVHSEYWSADGLTEVGAVTFGNGQTGISGRISESNSLIGSSPFDHVGGGSVATPSAGESKFTSFANGNYLVRSPDWDDGGKQDVGAVTFASGSTGITGIISASNSLIGATEGDRTGYYLPQSTPSGAYLVPNALWDRGDVINAGALTFGSASAGVTGTTSKSNSLVGATEGDVLGDCYVFSNGNYVAIGLNWDDGASVDTGFIAFSSSPAGLVGDAPTQNRVVGGAVRELSGPIIADDVNRNFYFHLGDNIGVGSQIDGFSRPWHLAIQPPDVNNDGQIVASDVLAIINFINAGHSSSVNNDFALGKPYGFLDVTGDGKVVPEDVIAVINYINAAHPTAGEALNNPTLAPIAAAATPSLNDTLLLLLAADSSSTKKRK